MADNNCSIDELIKNGYQIIIDTNVLLGVYRTSPGISMFVLDCLKEIEKNIVLPNMVSIEYNKHHGAFFNNMKKRFENSKKDALKKVEEIYKKIDSSCKDIERLQYPDVEKFRNALYESADSIKEKYESYFSDTSPLKYIENEWSTDLVYELFSRIEADGRVLKSPSLSEIYDWCIEGSNRYKKQIPPGFNDTKAKKNIGITMFSDLIMWKEILKYAKDKKQDIIFVTDDLKDDWWETDSSNNLIFHSSLIKEFAETKQQIFPIQFKQFLNMLSEEYDIEKPNAAILALDYTEAQHCSDIANDVYSDIEFNLSEKLAYYASSVHEGSEGITELTIDACSFDYAKQEDIIDNETTYLFYYNISARGTSYDYWGRTDPGDDPYVPHCNHSFQGTITVRVTINVNAFYERSKKAYEDAEFIDANLTEYNYQKLDYFHE